MSEYTAFPLDWPEGWTRTDQMRRQVSNFKTQSHNGNYMVAGELTVSKALERLRGELKMMKAVYPIISTNLPLRRDGLPYSDTREPHDPGAAVYFSLADKPHVLACDKWNKVASNLNAIAKHIEALRGMDRWGVGSVERAFASYTALPPPAGEVKKKNWREVFEIEDAGSSLSAGMREAILALCEKRYRDKARNAHLDAGGSDAAMVELNLAIEEARAELGSGT